MRETTDFNTFLYLTRILEKLYFGKMDSQTVDSELIEKYGEKWTNFKGSNKYDIGTYNACIEYYDGLYYDGTNRITIASDEELLELFNISRNIKIDVKN